MKRDSCKLPCVLSVFCLLSLQVVVNPLDPDFGACSSSEECTTWTLCSEYNSTEDSPCGGNLVELSALTITNLLNSLLPAFDYTIATSSSLFSQGATYTGHIIHGVCEGAEVTDPTQFPLVNSTTCLSKGRVLSSTLIAVDCGSNFIKAEGSGIIVRNCSNQCVDLYLVDYTSCSCEVKSNIGVSWAECAGVDVSRVLPSQSEECLRTQCLRFFDEACSCCSTHCVSDPSYSVSASSLCPSSLLNECGQNFSCEMNCTMGSLRCDAMPGQSVCQKICDDPFKEIELPGLIDSVVMEFCANQIRSRSCSNLTLLDRNCTDPSEKSKCTSVCLQKNEVVRFLSDGCPVEVFQFCNENFIKNLYVINPDDFTTSVSILQEFLGSVSPSFIVPTLSDLLQVLVVDQLDILSQAEIILSLFDNLFDDLVSYEGIYDSLSDALLLLETVLELISADILERNVIMPFIFEGKNLFISVGAPNRTHSEDNRTTVQLRGNESLADFNASVSISTNILCKTNDSDKCSSVVALAAVNNLADNLHQAAVNRTSEEQFEFSEFVPATDLLSLQVFGVEDLRERLLDSPVEFVITLPMHNVTERDSIECVFWNHTLKSWSNEGVTAELLFDGRVKCTSTHLTGFAVLVSLNPNITSTALSVISTVGCAVSVVFLLATIFCLLVFFKSKLLQKVHYFIHLNLAITLFLAYLMFVVGIETARANPGACIFVAAWLHYFFLSSFSWMLCEGIMLYLMLVLVFSQLSKKWWMFLLIGYGLPLPIVVVTAGVLRRRYISTHYCWLDAGIDKAAIWTFVVPMILVILVNIVFLIVALVKVFKSTCESILRARTGDGQRRKGEGLDAKERSKLVKKLLIATLVLLPLLGVTWILGLFAVNEETAVFAWLFTIFNSLQGFFIFFFHVMRSEQVWQSSRAKAVRTFIAKRISSSSTGSTSVTQNSEMSSNVTPSEVNVQEAHNVCVEHTDVMSKQFQAESQNGLHGASH